MSAPLTPEAATAKVLKAMRFKVAASRKNQRLVDAGHEAGGHGLINLFDGTDYQGVALAPHASVPKPYIGQLLFCTDSSSRRVVGPNLLARCSGDLAGMIAEEVLTGTIDPPPKSTEDLYKACARLGFSPATATNEDLAKLWPVMRRVRAVLGMRKDAVKALAEALAHRGHMTRSDCVAIARANGVLVGAPTFRPAVLRPEWVGLVREDARVTAACVEAWRPG